MITDIKTAASHSPARRRAALLAVAIFALTVAGCSGAGASGPEPVPSATGDLVSAQESALGSILVDGQGMTVYQFVNDKGPISTCTGSCSSDWPLVPASKTLPSSLPGVTGEIGTTTSGTPQLTVAGHPLYTFAGDAAPGDTNGQGVTLNGGLWTAVTPDGSAVTKTNPSGSSGTTY